MKSAARVMDHPMHPMIIPYPFAFLSGAAAFDVAAAALDNDRLADTARHLTTTGIAMALVAAVPGLIDYVTTVPAGKPRNTATKHMISNLTALACFAAAANARGDDRQARPAVLALELIGTAMLSIGGWLGGSLVYHHDIAVDPRDGGRRALGETHGEEFSLIDRMPASPFTNAEVL
jgi:uncharacterized membrane protein